MRQAIPRSAEPNAALPFILPNPALSVVNSKVVTANGGRVRFFRDIANVTMDLDDVEGVGELRMEADAGALDRSGRGPGLDAMVSATLLWWSPCLVQRPISSLPSSECSRAMATKPPPRDDPFRPRRMRVPRDSETVVR